MAGYVPKVASPETRAASLLEERRLLRIIEANLKLSPKERDKLPPRMRENLYKFEKEGRKP